jgi:hypothetical protein
MHQVSPAGPGIAAVEFGFDLESLFIRIDGTRPMSEILAAGLDLVVRFLKPAGTRLIVRHDGALGVHLARRDGGSGWTQIDGAGVQAAVGSLAEMRIPFEALGGVVHAPLAFFVALTRGEHEVELHPAHGPIELEVPDGGFAAINWTA